MQNPMPVNLKPSSEIEAMGHVAEARDSDGHLISWQAWLDDETTNENLRMLGDFIGDYDQEYTVQVFTGNVASKL